MTTTASHDPWRPEPHMPHGPPIGFWHLIAALCRIHPLRWTPAQVVQLRRLDTCRTSGGVDEARLLGLEMMCRTSAADRALMILVVTAKRARRRPLAQLRRIRSRGTRLTATLAARLVRDENLERNRYERLKLAAQAAVHRGDTRLRPLTGWWRRMLPVLLPLEVIFSAALYARLADIELIDLGGLTLPAMVAWGVMLLIALVTALAVHVAGRRIADPRATDRYGHERPWLAHVLAPGLIVAIVSGFYGSSAYLRMQALVSERGGRLSELSSMLPWTYGVLLGIAPFLLTWSIARAHTPEQDALRAARREDRRTRRRIARMLRRIDDQIVANQRLEDELRGLHHRADVRAQEAMNGAEAAVMAYRAHLAGAGFPVPGVSAGGSTELIRRGTANAPWTDILAELEPEAEGRAWVGAAAMIRHHLVVREARMQPGN